MDRRVTKEFRPPGRRDALTYARKRPVRPTRLGGVQSVEGNRQENIALTIDRDVLDMPTGEFERPQRQTATSQRFTAATYLQTDDSSVTVLDDCDGSFKGRLWTNSNR